MDQFELLRDQARAIDHRCVIATCDTREAHAETVRSWVAHRMELDCQATLDVELHSVPIGHLCIMRLRYGADVDIIPGALPAHVLLQVVLSGRSQIQRGSNLCFVDCGCGIITEDLAECRFAWSADCEQIIIPISKSAIAIASERITGMSAPREYGFHRSFSLSNEGQSLTDLLLYTLRLTTQTEALRLHLSQPLEAMLAHEIVVKHSTVQRAPQVYRPIPGYMFRAERFIADNLECEFSIAELASYVGISIRTLSEGFRRFRNCSPLSAVKEMRLEKLRELLVEGSVQSVTDIALRFHFNHVGRFAAVYKARFGEFPSQTLARAVKHSGMQSA